MSKRTAELERLATELRKSFGDDSAALGGVKKPSHIIPTGSLTLDYELGTGGWPTGYLCGIFGPRDIGKSSILGLNAIRNAQAMGMNCAIIAMEPNFDEHWARKHGVDPDALLLAYPQHGEEAFNQLHKILRSGVVDLVLFDSIGALVGEGEAAEDGKARQGGQASMITWGVKVAAPLAFRNSVCVLLLNQVRHNMSSRIPGVMQQPGGEALEHLESIIVQMKRGKDRYTVKDNGTDVEIGRSIVCHIQRNKMSEGSGKKAVFDFYSAEADGYPFGIDVVADTLNIGKRLGIIASRGAWLDLPNGKSFNGAKACGEYLDANPEAVAQIREGVMEKMRAREASARGGVEKTTEKLTVTPKKKEPVLA